MSILQHDPDHAEHPGTVGHATPAPDACSVQWDHDATSAFGTAATATCFVVLEQPGPWGRDAARESHLDAAVGTELDARTSGAGGRFMLMRRSGAHPDDGGPRRVLVAHAGVQPADAWLLTALVHSPGDLLGLDWNALANGSRALVTASLDGAHHAEPQLLVCTNGRRDVCCAVRGRPVAAAAAAHSPDRVWEVSHTGGHRFAPTAVLLPWGQTLARLDDASVGPLLDATLAGRVTPQLLGPAHDRGRSAVAGPQQVAEAQVRAAIGETSLTALWSVAAPDTAGAVEVQHVDGRTWQLRVQRRPAGRQRPESCGKSAIEVLEYAAELVTPSAG